ncbi:hypothetical protein BMWSH_1877 [Priestia megaterium WSH-002]|uniref:Uncharacterized protein n=1 Tax=Priestia megaterium (strain WSH-002) TaxID=1006007 RepID=A0A8D3WXN9_PRIMW|nr:hypothetical protein BMWSH_1877 [Priestia megaterium WSH-002]
MNIHLKKYPVTKKQSQGIFLDLSGWGVLFFCGGLSMANYSSLHR